eukprot:TRINITY_DN30725_c0_g1_i1.p1 TRINITY_DN30725_c0_g1~~TRINITY_DN30725_c0_g1_i1.p1  ORF type:complete len:208 (+),score=19.59 TRINITY_DN30725_c0_g1_i1:76-699(+)
MWGNWGDAGRDDSAKENWDNSGVNKLMEPIESWGNARDQTPPQQSIDAFLPVTGSALLHKGVPPPKHSMHMSLGRPIEQKENIVAERFRQVGQPALSYNFRSEPVTVQNAQQRGSMVLGSLAQAPQPPQLQLPQLPSQTKAAITTPPTTATPTPPSTTTPRGVSITAPPSARPAVEPATGQSLLDAFYESFPKKTFEFFPKRNGVAR